MTRESRSADDSATGRRRLLLVVAHPDDETFGCGSLLLHAADRGFSTAVVCATRGEAGEAAATMAPSELAATRERELRTAATALGVSQVDLLAFHDSGMSGPPAPGALADTALNTVIDQVRDRIDEVRPHVLITLDAGDGHRDHTVIRDATLAAAQTANWQADAVYLQCLPRSLMTRWAAHMARHDPSWEHLRAGVPGTPDDLITTVIDTTRHLPERERAVAIHASQRSPYDALPADLRHAFLATEYLTRVHPEWGGGPPENDLMVSSGPRGEPTQAPAYQ